MPTKKAHKDNTATFEELTFGEQAKSINAMVNNLQHSVRAHVRRAGAEGKDRGHVLAKCRGQIQRLLKRMGG